MCTYEEFGSSLINQKEAWITLSWFAL